MLARARANTFPIVTAFGGNDYVQDEWRKVPAGFEESAKNNPYLELKDEDVKDVVDPAPKTDTDPEPQPKKGKVK